MYSGNIFYYDLLHYIFCLCCFIPVWVIVLLLWCSFGGQSYSSLRSEQNLVELLWTLSPSFLVGLLCFYNLRCAGSEVASFCVNNVKVVGRQWYWSYEVVGETGLYDSLMQDFIDSVDKPLRLCAGSPYQLLVTSSDVIHSFSVPHYKMKLDAIPGRVNQAFLVPETVGVFVGYCSELCGAGHAYMPIVAEVVEKPRC